MYGSSEAKEVNEDRKRRLNLSPGEVILLPCPKVSILRHRWESWMFLVTEIVLESKSTQEMTTSQTALAWSPVGGRKHGRHQNYGGRLKENSSDCI